jgi:hypothetical protein
MHPSCPGNAARRTRQAQQEGGEHPVRQRLLTLVEQGVGEVIAGALAALTPGAFAAGTVLVRAPAANVMALAPRTLEWTIFPPERMDGGLALVSIEKVVHIGEYRHD